MQGKPTVVSPSSAREERTGTIELHNAYLRLGVLPGTGGGIARFDWLEDGGPLMRPCDDPETTEPNRLGCYPLLPWSNRIAHGGFVHEGRAVTLSPNRYDDPYPIHGSGWQRPWTVEHQTRSDIVLSLRDATEGAYAFEAEQRFTLDGPSLDIRLRVVNTGAFVLPFGLGVHPFFPRDAETRLQADAAAIGMNDGEDPLPIARMPVPGEWDFRASRRLPNGGLNHAFTGWSGRASIHWPHRALSLHVEAEADVYVLYVPAGEDFFCFEPVDHPINAVHLPGGAVVNGMTALAPGQQLERRFRFRVEAGAA